MTRCLHPFTKQNLQNMHTCSVVVDDDDDGEDDDGVYDE